MNRPHNGESMLLDMDFASLKRMPAVGRAPMLPLEDKR